jgi:hypothetical protein
MQREVRAAKREAAALRELMEEHEDRVRRLEKVAATGRRRGRVSKADVLAYAESRTYRHVYDGSAPKPSTTAHDLQHDMGVQWDRGRKLLDLLWKEGKLMRETTSGGPRRGPTHRYWSPDAAIAAEEAKRQKNGSSDQA